jgi:hypothetical protein
LEIEQKTPRDVAPNAELLSRKNGWVVRSLVGSGQGGPCLTDAAQVARSQRAVREFCRYAAVRTKPQRSSRPQLPGGMTPSIHYKSPCDDDHGNARIVLRRAGAVNRSDPAEQHLFLNTLSRHAAVPAGSNECLIVADLRSDAALLFGPSTKQQESSMLAHSENPILSWRA